MRDRGGRKEGRGEGMFFLEKFSLMYIKIRGIGEPLSLSKEASRFPTGHGCTTFSRLIRISRN